MATINGTAGNDNLRGTVGTDLINGLDGDDIIEAAENDAVLGGAGDDHFLLGLIGPLGAFSVDGGDGYDVMVVYLTPPDENPFSFSDILARGASFQNIESIAIYGTNLSDGEINGSSYNESIYGGNGTDFLFGLGGNDVLWDNGGTNRLSGGDDDDFLIFDLQAANDPFLGDGGNGRDKIIIRLQNVGGPVNFSVESALSTGSTATGVESYQIEGSLGDDVIIGSNLNDEILGDLGNDSLYGGDGNDNLQGQGGQDSLFGGNGNDTLFIELSDPSSLSVVAEGGVGNDELFLYLPDSIQTLHLSEMLKYTRDIEFTIIYSNSQDNLIYSFDCGFILIVYAGGGNDTLIGSGFTDYFNAGDGDDLAYGQEGDDHLSGNEGDDFLYGGLGNDDLWGGDGNDLLLGGEGSDFFLGGAGFDTVSYKDSSGPIALYFLTLKNTASPDNLGDTVGDGLFSEIEKVEGTNFSDVIAGFEGTPFAGENYDEVFSGLDGNDRLSGGLGYDMLDGGLGFDTLDGGIGFDYASYAGSATGLVVDLQFAASQNTGEAAGDSFVSIEGLYGSSFGDNLRGDQNDNWLWGNGGADYLFGRNGNDVLIGYGDTDTLVGEDGSDTLYGNDSSDYLYGGAGADSLNGGNGFDYALYSFAAASIIADLQFGSQNSGEAAGDGYTGIEGLVGSAFADSLRGDSGDNYLWSAAGNDALYGRDGNDVLIGGAGNDQLIGGAGSDTFIFDTGDGRDTIHDLQCGNGAGDVIQLATALGVNSYASLQARASQVGADTVITFDDNTNLTLLNTLQWSLAVDDFAFV